MKSRKFVKGVKKTKLLSGPAFKSAPAGKHRYEATVEKGPTQVKKEWNNFISGVNVGKEGMLGLSKRKDYAAVTNSDSIDDAELAMQKNMSTFSYLFSSNTAEKKQSKKATAEKIEMARKAREQKQRETEDAENAKKGQRKKVNDMNLSEYIQSLADKGTPLPDDIVMCKNRKEKREKMRELHEQAKEREIALDDNRKAKPDFDPKLAWYQQGGLNEISFKKQLAKGRKRGRQLNLKYNFLIPHPSWVAAKARQKKYENLIHWGARICFHDDDGAPPQIRSEVCL